MDAEQHDYSAGTESDAGLPGVPRLPSFVHVFLCADPIDVCPARHSTPQAGPQEGHCFAVCVSWLRVGRGGEWQDSHSASFRGTRSARAS